MCTVREVLKDNDGDNEHTAHQLLSNVSCQLSIAIVIFFYHSNSVMVNFFRVNFHLVRKSYATNLCF